MKQLLNKIIIYLEKDIANASNQDDLENRQAVVNYLKNSEGECVGLSTLWAYGKRIDDEEVKSKKPKDDIALFNRLQTLLLDWDEKDLGSLKEDKVEIDKFIANIRLFQKESYEIFSESGEGQLDLSVTLEDTKRGFPIKSFFAKGIFDKETLSFRLEKIVKPKNMIFISSFKKESSGHTMAVYQDSQNKKISFYDPNLTDPKLHGEREVIDFQELMDLFWERSNPGKFVVDLKKFDPVDKYLRGVEIEIFRFEEDPLYTYPSELEFKLTNEELINIFTKTPLLCNVAFISKEIRDLINLIEDKQVVELLDGPAPKELKAILVKNSILNANNKTSFLARYISVKQKSLLNEIIDKIPAVEKQSFFERAETYIQDFTEENKSILNLSEILYFLSLKPGDNALAEELFNLYKSNNPGSYDDTPLNIAPELDLAVYKNIDSNHLETAKYILNIVADEFKVLPKLQSIEDYRSVEIARFMYENYGYQDCYCNQFGNSALQFLHLRISHFNTLELKEKFMKEVFKLAFSENHPNNYAELVDNIIDRVPSVIKVLGLDDILCIILLKPGDNALAEELFNLYKSNNPGSYADTPLNIAPELDLAVYKNIDSNHLETAKYILKTVANEFKVLPKLTSIEDYRSEDIACFMYENYGYQDCYNNIFKYGFTLAGIIKEFEM